jgi:ribosomal protein S18 acetylase RimI-like enzyme
VPTILRLFDEAVAWLVGRGQAGQWGHEPFSSRESARQRAGEWAAGGGLRIAERGGEALGMVVLGAAPAYAELVSEPELYLQALVTSRAHAGEDIGGALVRRAYDEAEAAGIELVRVDCWAGAPRLVRWYEEQGFTVTSRFRVGAWEGQLFERRLRPPISS